MNEETYINVINTDFNQGLADLLPKSLTLLRAMRILGSGDAQPLIENDHRVYLSKVDLSKPIDVINRWAFYHSGWGGGVRGHGRMRMSLKWIGTPPLKVEAYKRPFGGPAFTGNSWWSDGRVTITPPDAPFIMINDLPMNTVTPQESDPTKRWISISASNRQLIRAFMVRAKKGVNL